MSRPSHYTFGSHKTVQNEDRKVALITGGSRGIGKAISMRLSKMGMAVVINYARDKQSAEDLAAKLNKKGGEALAAQADVSKIEQIAELFDTVISRFGRLDILVNNAGIATYKRIEEFSEEEYDRIFDVNVKGLFFCCKEAARKMADGGSIINIGSTVTRVMLPNYGAYAATKGAVEQITKVLAKELGSRNIRVNTLSPGPVDTALFRHGKSKEQIDQLAAMAALGRIGCVDDIADMVGVLVDEKSRWVSGQNILVNGGFAA